MADKAALVILLLGCACLVGIFFALTATTDARSTKIRLSAKEAIPGYPLVIPNGFIAWTFNATVPLTQSPTQYNSFANGTAVGNVRSTYPTIPQGYYAYDFILSGGQSTDGKGSLIDDCLSFTVWISCPSDLNQGYAIQANNCPVGQQPSGNETLCNVPQATPDNTNFLLLNYQFRQVSAVTTPTNIGGFFGTGANGGYFDIRAQFNCSMILNAISMCPQNNTDIATNFGKFVLNMRVPAAVPMYTAPSPLFDEERHFLKV
jgi:hypothetical protein